MFHEVMTMCFKAMTRWNRVRIIEIFPVII